MEDGSAIQDELISRNRSYWDFSVYSSKNKTNTASVVYLGNRFDNVQSQNEVIWERGLVPGCYQEKITCTFSFYCWCLEHNRNLRTSWLDFGGNLATALFRCETRGGGTNRSPERGKKKKFRAASASALCIWNQAFAAASASAPRIWIYGITRHYR